jgi:hypothetical protein
LRLQRRIIGTRLMWLQRRRGQQTLPSQRRP